jgi:hypothetical protein
MIHEYRERYLDCEGNIKSLATALAEDIHSIWGKPEPAANYIRALSDMAALFSISSQALTAKAIGDRRKENELFSLVKDLIK